jgi:hypothetical protein
VDRLKSFINVPNVLVSVIALFVIFAQTLPMLQVLNFEFSFLFSIFLFLASGILTIYYLRKFKSFGVLPAIIRMKYKSYLLLLLVPIIIAIISNLLFQLCPICDGILYYLVIVLPAFYFGFVSGAFAFWINKRFSYLIFTLIFLLFVFIPILEFYIYPQVYFFNAIVGIIPGTIYDEVILISSKLIIYRILHIIFFTVLLYSMVKVGNRKRKNKVILMLSTFVLMITFFLLKPSFGFATNENSLSQNLRGTIVTNDYIIHYADNLTKNNIQLLGLEHKFFMDEIKRKTKLSTSGKITSYIFKDSNQKGALFGSRAANVAKIWMNKIFLDFNSYEGALEHELIHSFAAEIGSTPLLISGGFNMAMLEGYAMAIEDNYSGYDIHYMALLAKESGYNFNIPELFSKFNFFNQTSSLSYITAGSFIKYLIEIYGIEKVNILYQDLEFEKHFKKNLAQLATEYTQFLDALNYPINKHRANIFFGRNPITKKVCPRTVSNEIKSAWKLYSEKSYSLSQSAFKTIFEYSNSYSALQGIIYANNKIEQYSESLKLLESKMKAFEGTSSYYSALINYGDQLAYNQQFEKADSVYQLLSEYQPTVRYKNLAEIRINLLSNNLILPYLTGSNFDKYLILKSMNNTELFDASIPIMIELSERLDENISTFCLFLEGKSIDDISSNTAYEVSKYLMKNLEFEKSLNYAELSMKNCNESFRLPILKSHRKKIEWFKNSY